MLEVILDTETTGLSVAEKHKIVEIGCIELEDQIPTKNVFHAYINPKRPVSEAAYKVHGYSDQFLSDKKTFLEISEDFLNFIKNKKIIIHNAPFDLSFLNYELKLINLKGLDKDNIIDTLEVAREKYPGSPNSLDALCKSFNIDNSKREKHSALVDCNLLKEVYINLLDQKAPKLNLENAEPTSSKNINNFNNKNSLPSEIVELSSEELQLHKKYLKTDLTKNNYS